MKRLVPVQPHGVLATTEAFEKTQPDVLLRLTKGMIQASRALHQDFDNFRAVYDKYVTVSVPAEQVKLIWEQERNSGGFAINGELTQEHWKSQMRLFYELNPERKRIRREDVIADQFVKEALGALGVHRGYDAPD